ncbi:MAG: hypothetical protein JKY19_11860 [Alcanivoracaceae bacterium]|nr:hypothetical protein [Alcanivoracaceae bacterium]
MKRLLKFQVKKKRGFATKSIRMSGFDFYYLYLGVFPIFRNTKVTKYFDGYWYA